MPDPLPDAYQRYREGVTRRHILCSGRYLSEMWLKESDSSSDLNIYLQHNRVFKSPVDQTTRVYVPWINEYHTRIWRKLKQSLLRLVQSGIWVKPRSY